MLKEKLAIAITPSATEKLEKHVAAIEVQAMRFFDGWTEDEIMDLEWIVDEAINNFSDDDEPEPDPNGPTMLEMLEECYGGLAAHVASKYDRKKDFERYQCLFGALALWKCDEAMRLLNEKGQSLDQARNFPAEMTDRYALAVDAAMEAAAAVADAYQSMADVRDLLEAAAKERVKDKEKAKRGGADNSKALDFIREAAVAIYTEKYLDDVDAGKIKPGAATTMTWKDLADTKEGRIYQRQTKRMITRASVYNYLVMAGLIKPKAL